MNFQRLAILNQGLAAVRIIQAVREYNALHQTSIATIAMVCQGEHSDLFVREADELVELGGPTSPTCWHDLPGLERALGQARADAAWVGWGPAAEGTRVAELCERLGVTLVGPGVALLTRALERERCREEARELGLEAASHLAAGHRLLEVPLVRDLEGRTWALGARDASVLRQGRRVLVETPPPGLSSEQVSQLLGAAERLAGHFGLEGLGSVEFLFDPARGSHAFHQFHPGLTAEHATTEAVSGTDLVQLQLHLARGGRLEGPAPEIRCSALEVRLNAEDPETFQPAPGRVLMSRLPTGPGLRVDRGFRQSTWLKAQPDPHVASLVAFGCDRPQALARLRRALQETALALQGGTTNKAFLLWLLDRPEVARGGAGPGWLDDCLARHEHRQSRGAAPALIQAALEVYDQELRLELARYFESAVRGRPSVGPESGRAVELRYRGRDYRLQVLELGPNRYQVEVDQASLEVTREPLGPYEQWLWMGGRRHRVLSVPEEGNRHRVEVDGVLHTIHGRAGASLTAPSPAVVVKLLVEPGERVEAGQPVAVLEAMKMESTLLSPVAGRVREVPVRSNLQVGSGTVLVRLDADEAETAAEGERVAFEAGQAFEAAGRASEAAAQPDPDRLTPFLLGYDVPASEVKAALARALKGELKASAQRREADWLALLCELQGLFRRPGEGEDDQASTEEFFTLYLRSRDPQAAGLPESFYRRLGGVLRRYGVDSLTRSPELDRALYRIFRSHARSEEQWPLVLGILERWLDQGLKLEDARERDSLHELLNGLVQVTRGRLESASELAREVRHRFFDHPLYEAAREAVYRATEEPLEQLGLPDSDPARGAAVEALVACPQPLVGLLVRRSAQADPATRAGLLEVLLCRYYRIREVRDRVVTRDSQPMVARGVYEYQGLDNQLFALCLGMDELESGLGALAPMMEEVPGGDNLDVDLYLRLGELSPEQARSRLEQALNQVAWPRPAHRVVAVLVGPGEEPGFSQVAQLTYRPAAQGYHEDARFRGLHPMMAKRMRLPERLAHFDLERLPSAEDVYLFRSRARDNPKDERLVAAAEVRDLTPVRDAHGALTRLPQLEWMLHESLAALRRARLQQPPEQRPRVNRVLLYLWPVLEATPAEIHRLALELAPATEDVGLEAVVVRARIRTPGSEKTELREIQVTNPEGSGPVVTLSEHTEDALQPLSDYSQQVLRLRQRGLTHPFEIVRMLTPSREELAGDFPPGEFQEYELNPEGALEAVSRPPGKNSANIVVGVLKNFTPRYPEGVTRVVLLGDPSKAMGALAEAECRRINAALDLAEKLQVPLEWHAVSAGARISMESGVENMDWIARVLRRIIDFTQAGGEINVLVNGINVGAQPYWNAEATMLMHTRGILIMTPRGAMVLTGKQALDYSGSVSAEDNFGIGGYDRVMGPNGQAQYAARDLQEGCQILLRHYDHCYRAPGERFPRRAPSEDPADRDVRSFPYRSPDSDFTTVGDIFSAEHNPERKKPFDVRQVMAAVVDQDHPPLERWRDLRNAETGVVWDAHLGGYPVCLLGFESHPVRRLGFIPADGPDQWTSGTLFPQSSRKVARAINAASGNRPLVVLANLSGFDGSPESMRRWQLEYGAEIGRAVVNFEGPVVFCVISRYHGGAYVVFSRCLNDNMHVAALEGSHASVIGGAPAAAVVFAGDVKKRTLADPRLREMDEKLAAAEGPDKARLRPVRDALYAQVYSEKLGEVAGEFDAIHSVERALRVGALDAIIPAARLRAHLIARVEEGMRRALGAEPVAR